jgi:hypothetical protein
LKPARYKLPSEINIRLRYLDVWKLLISEADVDEVYIPLYGGSVLTQAEKKKLNSSTAFGSYIILLLIL